MKRLYYLAYGSNLHPTRLIKRVPSATLIGKVELTETRIVFHKRSDDRSGKCMMIKDEINKPVAYAALFAIKPDEVALLDEVEACGRGYDKKFVPCPLAHSEYPAFTYIAAARAIDVSLKPYHWYKRFVLAGARYHQFPEHYILYLEGIESIQDPDDERRLMNEKILEELHYF